MWYRVFGASEAEPQPEAVLEHLHGLGLAVPGHFHGDAQGWYRAEFVLPRGATPLVAERFLGSEEGIRAELNAWAAWLETAEYSPHHRRLMQDVIATRQFFTVRLPLDNADEAKAFVRSIETFKELGLEGLKKATDEEVPAAAVDLFSKAIKAVKFEANGADFTGSAEITRDVMGAILDVIEKALARQQRVEP